MSLEKNNFERAPLLVKTFNPVYELGHTAMGQYSRQKYDLKVKRTDRLPAKGPVLVGPEHRSATDPFVVGVGLPRPIAFMQKAEMETLDYYYLGYLMRLFRAFPVNRGDPQPSTLKHARKLLKSGHAVGVFAEGSRYEDEVRKILLGDKLGDLHESIGWLAVTGDAPLNAVGVGTAVSEKGRIYKRLVVADSIYKQRGLPTRKAVPIIMDQFEDTLQQTFDEARVAATEAAAS